MLPLRSTVNPEPAVYVVTIAGSAGGFHGLRAFLAAMPPTARAAIVAMLHMGANSDLATALRGASSIPVECAAAGTLLLPGRAYVPPAGAHLIVNPDARLTLSSGPRRELFRPSGDWLFESAAASFGDRHICIVLSGRLHDGARQLEKV